MTTKYTTVVAFPPWEGCPLLQTHPQPTLTPMQIKYLPVQRWVTPEAVLFLHCPSSHLPHGLEAVQAWGFTYVTKISWLRFANPLPSANRTVWRTSRFEPGLTGDILVGSRSFVKPPDSALEGLAALLVQRDSEAPSFDPLYELVEHTWPAPYLHLFAPQARPNWDSWTKGKQPELDVQLLSDSEEVLAEDEAIRVGMERIKILHHARKNAPWEIGDILIALSKMTTRYSKISLWKMAGVQMNTTYYQPMLRHRISLMVPPNERNLNRRWVNYLHIYRNTSTEREQREREKRKRGKHASRWVDETFGFVDRRSQPQTTDEPAAPHTQPSEGASS